MTGSTAQRTTVIKRKKSDSGELFLHFVRLQAQNLD